MEHVRGSNLVEHGLQLLAKSLSINTLRLALEQLRRGRGRGRLGVKRREGEGKKTVSDWVNLGWLVNARIDARFSIHISRLTLSYLVDLVLKRSTFKHVQSCTTHGGQVNTNEYQQ